MSIKARSANTISLAAKSSLVSSVAGLELRSQDKASRIVLDLPSL